MIPWVITRYALERVRGARIVGCVKSINCVRIIRVQIEISA